MESDDVGDASKNNEPSVGDAGDKKQDGKVDYSTYNKAINQLKKIQEENKNLAETVNSLKGLKDEFDRQREEKTKRKEEDLLKQGEFKKLLELREQENATLKEQLQGKENEVTNSKKNLHDTWKSIHLQNALPGKIKKTEYLNYINFDEIPIDPDNGQPDKQAVQLAAEKFMKDYPELVDTTNIKSMPGNAPGTTGGKFPTVETFKELPLSEMKSNLREMVAKEKLKLGIV